MTCDFIPFFTNNGRYRMSCATGGCHEIPYFSNIHALTLQSYALYPGRPDVSKGRWRHIIIYATTSPYISLIHLMCAFAYRGIIHAPNDMCTPLPISPQFGYTREPNYLPLNLLPFPFFKQSLQYHLAALQLASYSISDNSCSTYHSL